MSRCHGTLRNYNLMEKPKPPSTAKFKFAGVPPRKKPSIPILKNSVGQPLGSIKQLPSSQSTSPQTSIKPTAGASISLNPTKISPRMAHQVPEVPIMIKPNQVVESLQIAPDWGDDSELNSILQEALESETVKDPGVIMAEHEIQGLKSKGSNLLLFFLFLDAVPSVNSPWNGSFNSAVIDKAIVIQKALPSVVEPATPSNSSKINLISPQPPDSTSSPLHDLDHLVLGTKGRTPLPIPEISNSPLSEKKKESGKVHNSKVAALKSPLDVLKPPKGQLSPNINKVPKLDFSNNVTAGTSLSNEKFDETPLTTGFSPNSVDGLKISFSPGIFESSNNTNPQKILYRERPARM